MSVKTTQPPGYVCFLFTHLGTEQWCCNKTSQELRMLSRSISDSHEIYIRSTDTTVGGARAWGRSWQKRPVRPFQLQLCQLLPVAASISASTRCMWIPVHFGVHFGVHFAFFS